MSAIIFDESFILRFDTHLTNTEVLSAMADNLCKRGIVKETYKKGNFRPGTGVSNRA